MLEISMWELTVIGIVALLVLGPEQLPKVAKTIGRWAGRARYLWLKVKAEMEETFEEKNNSN